MSSQASYGNFLFQTMDGDLNASLAVADELSKEFSSMLQEASSNDQNTSSDFTTNSSVSRDRHLSSGPSSLPSSTYLSSSTNGSSSSSSKPLSQSSTYYSSDSVVSSNRNAPSPPIHSNSPHASPKTHRVVQNTHRRTGSDSYTFTPQSPKQPPRSSRPDSPSYFERSPQSLIINRERSQLSSRSAGSLDMSSRPVPHQMSQNLHTSFDSNQKGHTSHQPDRGPSAGFPRSFSPMSLNSQTSSTLPRNFTTVSQTEESVKKQKSPGKWNETDLDVSYERKPHHTYDTTEWRRSPASNSNWRESNLDNPAPALNPKKDPRSVPHQGSFGSLPRGARIAVPPDASSSGHSPYGPQPIVSRVNMPPLSSLPRQSRRIPISVILRLQNPYYGQMSALQNQPMEGQGDFAHYHMPEAAPRKFFQSPAYPSQHYPPELRQPAVYSDALHAEDIDAEIQRLDIHHHPPALETPAVPKAGGEVEQVVTPAPRPLSPTRLQPVVAPEVQNPEIPDREELLSIRAEIPRALKRRGSVDVSRSAKKTSHYQPNQYKNIIHKLFNRKEPRNKGEKGSDSSSDGEEPAMPPDPPPTTRTPPVIPQDEKYNSILRKQGRKKSGRRAKLSPLVLLLDGALMGEMDTVMRAVKEMSDPSQSNDEGITGLHNAICGGHREVTDFLVRIGANVSAPDSHGWTPLHCAASCNDREMCEYLVRNGAAVMAFTHRDGATASQKCDPYLVGFEECESYLRAKEESMGVDNNGVLYALWSYQAQAPDELSFKEGDMVTILKKTDGSDWWWASLCGREGFVPNNFFGLFPKVRPKSLC
ncbi:relA-associated inhibitor isoform X2 [Gambusia affinis]|uniref:relA-associated inhibitor isoform X2 n=1 Tax=Gambusia affinis TaxID=33528 RepID=UPI001CDCFCC0|nr:relA-associated inhibitor isoform X2 [Gambusia affinis]XP_043974509.1 relA-associated inhibitor isoform X2 [Gambusia affinis]XP_043974510.1 relA-associated inhibitor isoform X2 [Gambusia affinis]